MSFCLDPYFISQADPADANYALEVAARNQFPLNVQIRFWQFAGDATYHAAQPAYTPNLVLAPTMAETAVRRRPTT